MRRRPRCDSARFFRDPGARLTRLDITLPAPFGVPAQCGAAPLPVGETGGSKGKGGGQGGGSPTRQGGFEEPSCSSRTLFGAKDGETRPASGRKPAIPSAREGRSPFRG